MVAFFILKNMKQWNGRVCRQLGGFLLSGTTPKRDLRNGYRQSDILINPGLGKYYLTASVVN